MEPVTLFTNLSASMQSAINNVILNRANAVMTAIAPTIIVGFALYMTIYGYMILSGRVSEPFTDFVIKAVRTTIIGAFALNYNLYLYLTHSVIDLQTDLTSMVAGTNGTNGFQLLDSTITQGITLIQSWYNEINHLHWSDWAWMIYYFACMIIIGVGLIMVVCVCGYLLFIASIFLQIMLALGPLFVSFLIFPVTTRYFDAWLGQIMTYLFKYCIASLVIVIIIKIYNAHLGAASPSQNAFGTIIELTALSVVLFKITLEISNVAAQLGGGMSMSVVNITRAIINPAQFVTKTAARALGGTAKAGGSSAWERYQNRATNKVRWVPMFKNKQPAPATNSGDGK